MQQTGKQYAEGGKNGELIRYMNNISDPNEVPNVNAVIRYLTLTTPDPEERHEKLINYAETEKRHDRVYEICTAAGIKSDELSEDKRGWLKEKSERIISGLVCYPGLQSCVNTMQFIGLEDSYIAGKCIEAGDRNLIEGRYDDAQREYLEAHKLGGDVGDLRKRIIKARRPTSIRRAARKLGIGFDLTWKHDFLGNWDLGLEMDEPSA